MSFVKMSLANPPRPPTRRAPLADASKRVNNAPNIIPPSFDGNSISLQHPGRLTPAGLPQLSNAQDSPGSRQKLVSSLDCYGPLSSPGANVANPRLSAISKEYPIPNSNRNSQISTTSTNGSGGRRKTHVGPWHLGKTLGEGSTARVRMARHAVTGQLAAIKIVQKRSAQLSQAGSIAALDQKDAAMNNRGEGHKRMPYSIEREVAIMKLIEHPHIMKLYDIWENRTEIYLVLEYIDNGELFEHIRRHGGLGEEEAIKYFRQLLSAVGYCHSFNICHRDLKPENILMTKNLELKVADFGMAALHQTPKHKLQTSCGSPHYAAPEVIRATYYRGDAADIWSMGVILFASLAGYLPFDHDELPRLYEIIKKGRFEMASTIGPEAADLIRKMLQVNPRDRINISEIWKQPLLRKYDYLDNYGNEMNLRPPDAWKCDRPLLRRSDIDRELLRHLRSMWHSFEEQHIIDLLLNNEPNEQKVFYHLLLKHRAAQQENYVPDIGHSTSDYHHVRPLAQVKKLSTRQFSQPNQKGHGHSISRFTVVSNVSRGKHSSKNSGYAATEAAETVQSYDPFRASRPQNLAGTAEAAQTNVTVYRGRQGVQELRATSRSSRNSTSNSLASRDRQRTLAPPRVAASRSSLASSTRSRSGTRGARLAVLHKRGVSFSHAQKLSGSNTKKRGDIELTESPNLVDSWAEEPGAFDDSLNGPSAIFNSYSSARYIRSRKATVSSSQPLLSLAKQDRASRSWNDDVRQLSSSLAKTCDEAFNRTSVASTPCTNLSGIEDSRNTLCESPISSLDQSTTRCKSSTVVPQPVKQPVARQRADCASLNSRPLPPPPTRSNSVNIELAEARKRVQLRQMAGMDSSGYLNLMGSHIEQLIKEPAVSPPWPKNDRRTLSAPVHTRAHEAGKTLPSIHESNREGTYSDRSSDYENHLLLDRVKVAPPSRNISAPEPSRAKRNPHYDLDDRTSRRDTRAKVGLRVVQPYSPSPAKPPAPLNIRKKSSHGPPLMRGANGNIGPTQHPPKFDLRQQYISSSVTGNYSHQSSVDERNRPYDPFADESSGGTVRKNSSWFKRSSKSREHDKIWSNPEKKRTSITCETKYSSARQVNVEDLVVPAKKKSFGFGRIFGKRSVKQDRGESVAEFEIQDDGVSIAESITEEQLQPPLWGITNFETPKTRQIEPQQNWLARLFNVKPAMRYICFTVSKRRAREEIASLLKEWRVYGTRDIVVDKRRNIVFGRVGPRNYFHMKEVAFASEILTVIEHGKRYPLSIARFTQEKGAASSLYKVVEKLEEVCESRGMLVTDERKRRMIIKTLNVT